MPDFDDVKRDILALNRHPDRQVLPDIQPGPLPGEWDVVLNVKDNAPLHGNLELNNRYSPDTTELRLNGGISYTNLWQAGHTIGFNFQIAPENLDDAAIYSGYYALPLGERTSLMVTGTKQDSNINTLGGAAVAGRGHVIGTRVNFILPEADNFYHSLSVGVDYKRFDEDLLLAGQMRSTPIEYYPVSMTYGGTWLSGKKAKYEHSTDFNSTLTMHPRGLGSDRYEFDAKRYEATGAFLQLRGDLSHTHDLPAGFQWFGKIQGQWSDYPLVSSEQFSGGGLGNARGYIESTVLGDSAIFGTVELRSPSFLNDRKSAKEAAAEQSETDPAPSETTNEWRVYAFADGGVLTLNDPLPDQDDDFSVLSVGVGSRISLWDHLHASLDAGVPLRSAGPVESGDWLMTFRLWYDF
ncbi:MAG: ShlB/FhaC/HecB family hemolysin secretion/activation protein [Verrucomicrobiales bacterium]